MNLRPRLKALEGWQQEKAEARRVRNHDARARAYELMTKADRDAWLAMLDAWKTTPEAELDALFDAGDCGLDEPADWTAIEAWFRALYSLPLTAVWPRPPDGARETLTASLTDWEAVVQRSDLTPAQATVSGWMIPVLRIFRAFAMSL